MKAYLLCDFTTSSEPCMVKGALILLHRAITIYVQSDMCIYNASRTIIIHRKVIWERNRCTCLSAKHHKKPSSRKTRKTFKRHSATRYRFLLLHPSPYGIARGLWRNVSQTAVHSLMISYAMRSRQCLPTEPFICRQNHRVHIIRYKPHRVQEGSEPSHFGRQTPHKRGHVSQLPPNIEEQGVVCRYN